MPKKHRRFYLREKEVKKILLAFSNRLKVNVDEILGPKTRIEIKETEDGEVFIFEGRPLLVKLNNEFFPTLIFREVFPYIPKVVVDMGAVPFVCKGANIMAPGVVSVKGQFMENDVVLVIDVRNNKPLAVGIALLASQLVCNSKSGKVVENIHYIGDKLWNLIK